MIPATPGDGNGLPPQSDGPETLPAGVEDLLLSATNIEDFNDALGALGTITFNDGSTLPADKTTDAIDEVLAQTRLSESADEGRVLNDLTLRKIIDIKDVPGSQKHLAQLILAQVLLEKPEKSALAEENPTVSNLKNEPSYVDIENESLANLKGSKDLAQFIQFFNITSDTEVLGEQIDTLFLGTPELIKETLADSHLEGPAGNKLRGRIEEAFGELLKTHGASEALPTLVEHITNSAKEKGVESKTVVTGETLPEPLAETDPHLALDIDLTQPDTNLLPVEPTPVEELPKPIKELPVNGVRFRGETTPTTLAKDNIPLHMRAGGLTEEEKKEDRESRARARALLDMEIKKPVKKENSTETSDTKENKRQVLRANMYKRGYDLGVKAGGIISGIKNKFGSSEEEIKSNKKNPFEKADEKKTPEPPFELTPEQQALLEPERRIARARLREIYGEDFDRHSGDPTLESNRILKTMARLTGLEAFIAKRKQKTLEGATPEKKKLLERFEDFGKWYKDQPLKYKIAAGASIAGLSAAAATGVIVGTPIVLFGIASAQIALSASSAASTYATLKVAIEKLPKKIKLIPGFSHEKRELGPKEQLASDLMLVAISIAAGILVGKTFGAIAEHVYEASGAKEALDSAINHATEAMPTAPLPVEAAASGAQSSVDTASPSASLPEVSAPAATVEATPQMTGDIHVEHTLAAGETRWEVLRKILLENKDFSQLTPHQQDNVLANMFANPEQHGLEVLDDTKIPVEKVVTFNLDQNDVNKLIENAANVSPEMPTDAAIQVDTPTTEAMEPTPTATPDATEMKGLDPNAKAPISTNVTSSLPSQINFDTLATNVDIDTEALENPSGLVQTVFADKPGFSFLLSDEARQILASHAQDTLKELELNNPKAFDEIAIVLRTYLGTNNELAFMDKNIAQVVSAINNHMA